MTDRPISSLDPERLKAERRDVDLGSAEETGHDHVSHQPDAGDSGTAEQPAIGSTPPAR